MSVTPDDLVEIKVVPRRVIVGERSFYVTGYYREALEAVEESRAVRVMRGARIEWEGTAGELLALAEAGKPLAQSTTLSE